MRDFGPKTMTEGERDEFLGGTPRYLALASLRKDGSPFVIPVGYLYEKPYIYITFAPMRPAVHRLRRDPRVSLTVFNDHYPTKFAVVVGSAEEVPDPDLEISLRKHRWMMQLADEHIDLEVFEREHFKLGRVVFRVEVSGDNVAAADASKLERPEVEGSMLHGERERYLGVDDSDGA